MSFASKLTDTVYIYRGAAARAATGTVTRSLPDEATATVKGRLIPKHGGAVQTEDGEFFEADAELYVPHGTDIRPEVGDSDATGSGDWVKVNSVVYLVLSVRDAAGRGKTLHCMLGLDKSKRR